MKQPKTDLNQAQTLQRVTAIVVTYNSVHCISALSEGESDAHASAKPISINYLHGLKLIGRISEITECHPLYARK